MDIFTDVDIFRDLVEVSTRGVVVYVLLDDLQFNSFLQMTEKANVPLQKLWVRITSVPQLIATGFFFFFELPNCPHSYYRHY